jgi:hypothetical protein
MALSQVIVGQKLSLADAVATYGKLRIVTFNV